MPEWAMLVLVAIFALILFAWFLITWLRPFWMPRAPTITDFTPTGGWPGSIVTITGARFGQQRDDNVVFIGGARALVLEAGESQLRVVAGEKTVGGPIEVTVDSRSTRSASEFRVLDYPRPDDVSINGAPVFFHGPQHSTIEPGVANQPVLVVLAYPPGAAPPDPIGLHQTLLTEFASANAYWEQVSFRTTSFSYEFTDWLELPASRTFRDYFYVPEDIDEARRALLIGTKRSIEIDGGTAYVSHALGAVDGGVSVLALGGSTEVEERGIIRLPSRTVTGFRAIGGASQKHGYAVTGGAGLYAVDLVNTPPEWQRHVPAPGYCIDLDATNDLLVVAALDAGLHVFDSVRYGGTPRLLTTITPIYGTEWPTAVRLVGRVAYVGAGHSLRIIDLTDPAAPVEVASQRLGAWAMDVDADDQLCVVATDGEGVRIFDLSGPTPAVAGSILAVTRAHAASLKRETLPNGTVKRTLLIADGDEGLHIYDVTDPANPRLEGQLKTIPGRSIPNMYAVAAYRDRAVVVLGNGIVWSIDVSNASRWSAEGSDRIEPQWYTNRSQSSSNISPDLPLIRAGLAVATDMAGLVKDWHELFFDAFTATGRSANELNRYVGFAVAVHGGPLRAAAPSFHSVARGGQSFSFPEQKGGFYMATDDEWQVIAHETGHWMGMLDIYGEQQEDGSFEAGTAEQWCLAGADTEAPLLCGFHMHDVFRFYEESNVATRTWSTTTPELDETFDIVAHDIAQNTDATRVHLVKLTVGSSLHYYIEVRQKPMGQLFDQLIPVTNSVEGIVLITRQAERSNRFSNTQERSVALFATLDVGTETVDAARRIRISVEALVQNRPLIYRVRVRWNQPSIFNQNGLFDLMINPWSTSTWETADIWIDSTRNNVGVTATDDGVRFENHLPNDERTPVLNGDRPWVRRENTIHARVKNYGMADANNVQVTFYATSPPGIGDNGNWATLGTVSTEPGPMGGAPIPITIPAGGEKIFEFPWTPDRDRHTCIKAAIFPQIGEMEPGNNTAQENVASFDAAGASSHEPKLLDAEVRNPFSVWRKIDVIVRGLPFGWHAVVNNRWVWTGPRGQTPVTVVMWCDLNAPYDFTPPEVAMLTTDAEKKIPPRALASIEGWTDVDHRYLPIGGFLADAKANRRVTLSLQVRNRGGRLFGRGCLEPAVGQVPVTIEISDAGSYRRYLHLKTDSDGCFDLAAAASLQPSPLVLPRGRYAVQAFVAPGGDAAETQSAPVTITVR